MMINSIAFDKLWGLIQNLLINKGPNVLYILSLWITNFFFLNVDLSGWLFQISTPICGTSVHHHLHMVFLFVFIYFCLINILWNLCQFQLIHWIIVLFFFFLVEWNVECEMWNVKSWVIKVESWKKTEKRLSLFHFCDEGNENC